MDEWAAESITLIDRTQDYISDYGRTSTTKGEFIVRDDEPEGIARLVVTEASANLLRYRIEWRTGDRQFFTYSGAYLVRWI